MKLYFAPGACSLSPHIVLREAGHNFELEQVNNAEKKTKSGKDYWTVNPKGQVPVLELDNGERLSEGPAIVQYIADQVPAKKLAPANGTFARARLQEWLNFTTSEIHKTYSPLFNPAVPEEYKTMARAKLLDRYKWIDTQLEGKDYLLGSDFSVADAYLFTVTNWTKFVGIDISSLANLTAYMARVAARPAVPEAMKAEGLLK